MNKTILIVDDDEIIRGLTSRFLQGGGFKVIAAAGGPDGVEKYRASRPDLVVLDIAMPGMSGFEVATSIRAMERDLEWPHVPIILLTAYARSFFISVGGETGITSYLTKPISPEQLLEHVNQFLADTPEAPPESV
jgi:CheY-like chemotaxis protein